MIKIEHIAVKIISVFVLMSVLIVSCKTNKRLPIGRVELTPIIDDYISDFSHFYDSDLEAIHVSFRPGQKIVEVQDYPLEHLYFDIRNIEEFDESVFVGRYKNIPAIIFVDSQDSFDLKDILKTDSLLIQKANIENEYFDEKGNKLDIEIEGGLMEYTPSLVTNYYVTKHFKKIKLQNGKTMNVEY